MIQFYLNAHSEAANDYEKIECPICSEQMVGRKGARFHLSKRSNCGKIYNEWILEIDGSKSEINKEIPLEVSYLINFMIKTHIKIYTITKILNFYKSKAFTSNKDEINPGI